MKTIYLPLEIAKDAGGVNYEGKPTFELNQAIRETRMLRAHLTDRELKDLDVYVGAFRVDVPEDEPRAADQIYHDMLDEDTWPSSWDVIEAE